MINLNKFVKEMEGSVMILDYIDIIKYQTNEKNKQNAIRIYIENCITNIFGQYSANIDIKDFIITNHTDNISLNDIKNECAERKVETIEYIKEKGDTNIFDNTIEDLEDNISYIGENRIENIQAGQSEAYYQLDDIIYYEFLEFVGISEDDID